ncbi:MAG: SUMF1/EgtB/PvdO family nonheme iron enzyme [Planctomycetota bacterium]|nr:SUMF1/EgtB/PvdO family nonheme iron enzyme [Planctomycetota bacterium]
MRTPAESWFSVLSLCAAFALAAVLTPAPALAQPGWVDPVSGQQFVRITHPGNAAYSGFDPFGYTTGRGSVGYEYNIARMEVTTGQWLEFFNTFMTRAQPVPWLWEPGNWGAQVDPDYQGPGTRYRLRNIADAAGIGAHAVSWRTAAMYCNWLHNNKSTDLAAIQNGAYDTSTFVNLGNGQWTDQVTRSEGARYWIPSLDEWLKAAHWDPNNLNNNGWWTYSNGSETPLTYGPPPAFGGDGTGQANSGFTLPGFRHYDIPLGSYPDTPSVWGLLDIAGGGSEWTEGVLMTQPPFGNYRINEGSRAGGTGGGDSVYGIGGGQYPYSTAGDFNLRLASSLPHPGTL